MISRINFQRKGSKLQAADSLMRSVSERTGIVKSLNQVLVERDDPRVFNVMAIESSIQRLVDHGMEADIAAAAAGFSLSDAIERAIGEALERYALAFCDLDVVTFGSYNELSGVMDCEIYDPEKLFFFSDAQYQEDKFPFTRFCHDTVVGWAPATSLATGETCLFPAQMLFFGYQLQEGEAQICYATSNGCAAGQSISQAVLKGCLEAVERDGVMLTWFRKVANPRLDISRSAFLQDLMEVHFACPTLVFNLLLADTGVGIPTVIGIVLDEASRRCRFVMGAAANLDPEQAAVKALLESGGQGRPYLKFLSASRPVALSSIDELQDFPDTLVFYGAAENYKYVSFLLDSQVEIPINSVPSLSSQTVEEDLLTTVKLLYERGFHPYYVDLTTPDLRYLGVSVVRAVVPDLVPFSSPAYPYLGPPRLLSQEITGGVDPTHGASALNCLPHPFP